MIQEIQTLVNNQMKPVNESIKKMIRLLTNHVIADSLCYVLVIGLFFVPNALWLVWPQSTFVYFGGILYTFGVLPLLDLICPRDKDNLTTTQIQERKTHQIYKIGPLVYPIFVTGYLYWAINHYVNTVTHLPLLAKLGFFGSLGTCSAVSINVGHELFHKKDLFECSSGIYLLFTSCYSQFFIEHLWGHHKHVGTPRDAASARKNELIYTFVPKSFLCSIVSSFSIEQERCKKLKLPWYSNRIIQYQAIQGLICWIIYQWFGSAGLVAFLGQSVMGIILVETVNYIEHYGLQRSKINGRYEPVNVLHSWNATETITNYLLLKLQRHSDHHAYPQKRYQTLSTYNISPQLPTGYPGMIVLATIPPLFFKVINPLLDEQLKKMEDVRKVHVNNKTNTLTITRKKRSESTMVTK